MAFIVTTRTLPRESLCLKTQEDHGSSFLFNATFFIFYYAEHLCREFVFSTRTRDSFAYYKWCLRYFLHFFFLLFTLIHVMQINIVSLLRYRALYDICMYSKLISVFFRDIYD